MCGLIGYSVTAAMANNSKFNYLATKLMLLDSAVRGDHSTGIGYLDKSGKSVFVYKEAITPAKFTSSKTFFNSFQNNLPKTLVGHTRFATIGDKTNENAHPFLYSGEGKTPVVGTHNGWLIDFSKTHKKDEEAKSFQSFCKEKGYEIPKVDSAVIFKHIFETQNESAFRDIEGAMALAFIFNKKLFLYRRKSKPLFYLESFLDNSPQIFYASRKESILSVFGEEYSESVKEVPVDTLLVINNGKIEKEISVPEPSINIGLDESPSFFYMNNSFHSRANTGRGINIDLSDQFDGNLFEKRSFSQPTDPRLKVRHDLIKEINTVINNNNYNHSFMKSCGYNVFNHPMYDRSILKELGYKEVEWSSRSIKKFLKQRSVKEDSMILILGLQHKNKIDFEATFKGWKVSIEGREHSYLVSEKNKIGITITPNKLELDNKRLTLLLHPPDDLFLKENSSKYIPLLYYVVHVDIYLGQVSEVACDIPFFCDFAKSESGRSVLFGQVVDPILPLQYKFATITNYPAQVTLFKKDVQASDDNRKDIGDIKNGKDGENNFPSRLSDKEEVSKNNPIKLSEENKKNLSRALDALSFRMEDNLRLILENNEVDKENICHLSFINWASILDISNLFFKFGLHDLKKKYDESMIKTIQLYSLSNIFNVSLFKEMEEVGRPRWMVGQYSLPIGIKEKDSLHQIITSYNVLEESVELLADMLLDANNFINKSIKKEKSKKSVNL